MEGLPLLHSERDFVTIILILGFGVIAYVRTTYPVRWSWVIKGAFSRGSQLERDDRYWLNNFNAWMWIVFLIGTGSYAFIFQTYYPIGSEQSVFSQLFTFLGGLAVYYLIKFAFIYLIGVLFRIPKTISKHTQLRFTSIHFGGIVFLASVVLVLFLPVGNKLALQTGGIIGLVLLIFGLLRQLYHLSKGRVKLVWFYIILYICTLEIAPLLFFFEMGLKV